MVCSTRTERLLGALLLGLGWAGPASAEDLTQARATAGEARRAFERNDFTGAIDRYEAAYRLKPAPGLLFNLAQSHRLAGNLAAASSYFTRFLQTRPPRFQAEVTGLLLRQLELERGRVEGLHRLEQEQARLVLARSEALTASRRLEAELALQADWAAHPITTRWWFWSTIAAVVAGTAVALVALTTPAW